MLRVLIVNLYVFLLCSCQSFYDKDLLVSKFDDSAILYINEIDLDSKRGYAIIGYHSPYYFLNRYSKNGAVLGSVSYWQVDENVEISDREQLIFEDYINLYTLSHDNVDFNIEYDKNTSCLKDDLDFLAAMKNSISSVVPQKLLGVFSLKYNVKVRLTPKKGFRNIHLIDPREGNMIFYYHIDCNNNDMFWMSDFVSSAVHEMTHVEQRWGADYRKITKPLHLESDSYYPIIEEFIANRMEVCSIMTSGSYFRTYYGVESFYFNLHEFVKYFTSDSTRSNWFIYSSLGKELAKLWFSKFIDQDGFISRDNELQYKKVVEDCMETLSRDSILSAGNFINNLFHNLKVD